MKKTKLLVAALSVALGVAGLVSPHAYAAVQTCTWTGTAGDYKFSTGTNWSNCNSAAPQAGDILLFSSWVGPANGGTSNAVNLTNDLSSIAFGGVVVDGPTTDGHLYVVDTMKLTDGGSFQRTVQASGESLQLYITQLSSTGAVTLDDSFVGGSLTATNVTMLKNAGVSGSVDATNVTFKSGASGWTSIENGQWSLGGATNVIAESSSSIVICSGAGVVTLSNNFTFGGGAGTTNPQIDVEPCRGVDGQPAMPTAGLNLTGKITLLGDATINTLNSKLVMDGTLDAQGHKLTLTAASKTIVMGKGSVGDISLTDGSIIAPGASPGCLATGNITWVKGAEYSFDLGGTTVCTEYDQIRVAGTVGLGDGTLTINPYGAFTPKSGDVFTIIDNDGSDAVAGTFSGLVEGATFTQNGVLFKISYKGGDGNDVTLTVMNKPTVPNTGFALLQSNSIANGLLAVAAAVVLFLLGRKLQATRR